MKNCTLGFTIVVLLFIVRNNFGQVADQLPLDPKDIPQFVDPLPHFAGQRIDASGGNLIIRYQPAEQMAVSTGTELADGIAGETPNVGKARLWTYSVSNGVATTPAHWPAFTIVAQQGIPVNVMYENNLDGETYEDVGLIVDQTIHWAAPTGMDMDDMGPYTGPVPVVPHLHGGEVASESDGGPEAWFTPGYEYKGSSWGNEGTDEQYYYPNQQEPATLWWHDHALGATRLNVYAGLAGFYLLKGDDEENAKLPGWSGDDLVQEIAPSGTSGIFNPKPYLPEIEIVFQDRMFDTYGKLYFPNFPPNPEMHPFWTPEFVGDVITVNGKTWPYLSVAPRKYRFRLLNGSNARFYEIWLQDPFKLNNAPCIVQVGTDGGLLDSPVIIGEKLLLAPGERADVVIDFSKSAPGQVWTMRNSANAPYPNGTPPEGSTLGRLMQFVVNGKMVSASNNTLPGTDKSRVPFRLRSRYLVKLTNFAGATRVEPVIKRQLTLNEVMGMGGPLEVLINNSKYSSSVTEQPVEGTTELWQIINLTADAHPIHLHLVQFQLVSRQRINVKAYDKVYNAAFGGSFEPAEGPPRPYNIPNRDGAIGGNPAISPFLQRGITPALPNERGWKDTYVVKPGEVTTFIIRFAPTHLPRFTPAQDLKFAFDPGKGPGYVWHCHIIDHEDNEMMRPYSVQTSPFRFDEEIYKSTLSKSVSESEAVFELMQNYPNPFSGETTIQFVMPGTDNVKLVLINQSGQLVQVLIDGVAPAGMNTVKLNAGTLKPGIYFYQLNTGKFNSVKKMTVIK